MQLKLSFEGPQSLKNLEKEYREMRLKKERQEQDEAYALDKIALQEEPIEDFLVKLKLARRMRRSCRKTFLGWFEDVLKLEKIIFQRIMKTSFHCLQIVTLKCLTIHG